MTNLASIIGRPAWVGFVAALGFGWNIFGVFQFFASLARANGGSMSEGMTAPQAAAYYALPMWMSAAFAIGVFAGAAGSVALWRRRGVAIPIFSGSLLAYIALWTGDYAHGLFDILPGQMAILNSVVTIAAGLLVASVLADRKSLLR